MFLVLQSNWMKKARTHALIKQDKLDRGMVSEHRASTQLNANDRYWIEKIAHANSKNQAHFG